MRIRTVVSGTILGLGVVSIIHYGNNLSHLILCAVLVVCIAAVKVDTVIKRHKA